jgi:hypothetical protein
MAGVIAATAVSVFVLAFSSVYSAWVAANNHHTYCTRTDVILDTFHDVIQLAFTPQQGQVLTAKQVASIQAFEARAFARIDQARC